MLILLPHIVSIVRKPLIVLYQSLNEDQNISYLRTPPAWYIHFHSTMALVPLDSWVCCQDDCHQLNVIAIRDTFCVCEHKRCTECVEPGKPMPDWLIRSRWCGFNSSRSPRLRSKDDFLLESPYSFCCIKPTGLDFHDTCLRSPSLGRRDRPTLQPHPYDTSYERLWSLHCRLPPFCGDLRMSYFISLCDHQFVLDFLSLTCRHSTIV